MRRFFFATLLLAACVGPTLAGDPGQVIDRLEQHLDQMQRILDHMEQPHASLSSAEFNVLQQRATVVSVPKIPDVRDSGENQPAVVSRPPLPPSVQVLEPATVVSEPIYLPRQPVYPVQQPAFSPRPMPVFRPRPMPSFGPSIGGGRPAGC